MMASFPLEIWIAIIAHLPGDNLYKLLGVNRSVFNYVMDKLYEQVGVMIVWNSRRAIGSNVKQLKYPSVASRARLLRIDIPPSYSKFNYRGPFVNVVDRLGKKLSQQQRSKAITYFVPVDEHGALFTNVECLQILVGDAVIYKPFMSFIGTFWGANSSHLHTLHLQFDESMLHTLMSPLLGSVPNLPNLTDFTFFAWNYDAKERKPTATGLQVREMTSWIISILSSSAHALRSLSLLLPQEIHTTDLFYAMAHTPLPHLQRFLFAQSSGKDSFPSPGSGSDNVGDVLSKFLEVHCKHNLEHLILEPFFFVSWRGRDTVKEINSYLTWLKGSLVSLDLPNLRILQVGLPTYLNEECYIDSHGNPCLSRMSDRLDTLVLLAHVVQTQHLPLLFPLPNYRLRKLSILIDAFTSKCLDLLARNLPGLKALELRFSQIGIVESDLRWVRYLDWSHDEDCESFVTDLQRYRNSDQWFLKDLSLVCLYPLEGTIPQVILDALSGYIPVATAMVRVGDSSADYYFKSDSNTFLEI
ncbi:hypothetical protein Moror_3607 [Moniliophthora roreri MCA 2997]|uniref:F-box domain-containing protein n=2 Tax=Moniliophthora roreri TaxID=221103 RepID=V2WE74_MONRO|nr:hypothetical protein Moror_3607 [Moniliophthora roreri MCA 2997]KAI3605864.1 hypothetical protein WG66_012402 [Moniliophthora roreri]